MLLLKYVSWLSVNKSLFLLTLFSPCQWMEKSFFNNSSQSSIQGLNLFWDETKVRSKWDQTSRVFDVRCGGEAGWYCPCMRSSCLNWVILPRIERMELNLRKFLALDPVVDTQQYLHCYIPERCLKVLLQFIQQWFKRSKFRLTQIILLFLLQTVLVLLNQKLIDL